MRQAHVSPHRIARYWVGRSVVIGAILVVAALLVGAMTNGREASAQTATATPTAPPTGVPGRPQPTEAQILSVERQLLCPLCVNERLDVCSIAICDDMKRVIRERLTAGSTPDDIILFFETRYGPKVRARLPREGFNLILFGWVGGALLLTILVGAYALISLRRQSDRRRARVTIPMTDSSNHTQDDGWVDDLVRDGRDPPSGAR